MKKNELFQIGEVSKLFHISVSILRHYEKIGLLKPEYVDTQTGYRYYSVSQFECLNTIRYLRALDMPLDKIGFFLVNRDVDQIRSLLVDQKAQVEQKRHELMLVEQKISRRIAQIDAALSTPTDTITLETKPARRLAFLKRQIVPHSYLDLETSIRELEKQETTSVTFLGKVGLGLSPQALMNGHFQPYEFVFIILDEEDEYQGKSIQLPQETCAVIRFQGSHGASETYYQKLLNYMVDNHLEPAGFSKEITMIDNGMTDDESQFVTEIQIPVREAGL